MSETRFTPGPWVAETSTGPRGGYGVASLGVWSQHKFDAALDENDDDVDPEDASWVCGIWGKIDEEDKANARLIAAAPELYEWLDLADEALEALDVPSDSGVRGEISRVLAKARGEA